MREIQIERQDSVMNGRERGSRKAGVYGCFSILLTYHCLYLQEYNVYYVLARISSQPYDQWLLSTTSNTLVVISHLQVNEVYSVSVQARTAAGVGPYSHPIQFTMTQGGESGSTPSLAAAPVPLLTELVFTDGPLSSS